MNFMKNRMADITIVVYWHTRIFDFILYHAKFFFVFGEWLNQFKKILSFNINYTSEILTFRTTIFWIPSEKLLKTKPFPFLIDLTKFIKQEKFLKTVLLYMNWQLGLDSYSLNTKLFLLFLHILILFPSPQFETAPNQVQILPL